MKNVDVLGINLMLSEVSTEGLYGVKLSHALIKNAKAFQEEAEIIKKTLVYSEDFLKYTKEIEIIFKEHALKNEEGELIVDENKYQIDPEKKEQFKKLQKEKQEANNKVIEEAKKVEEVYNNSLNNEKNVTIAYVTLDELPESITPDQMNALSFMIEDI